MIFSLFFFILASLIGKLMSSIRDKNTHLFTNFIVGYMLLFIIHWPIGFFAQLLHLSWQYYFWLYTSILTIMLAIVAKQLLQNKKFNFTIMEFDKLVLIIGIAFGLFSLLYIGPMYHANWQDDGFYLAKIAQEIGQPQILMTNPMIGNSENMFSLIRGFNTYELFYSYWADLFNIDPVIIARISFTMINSIFIASCVGIFSLHFFKKNAWLVMLGFSIFLLPNELITKLQLFLVDGWRLNTTLWYGSTVVQMTAIPMYFILIEQTFTNKITMKQSVSTFFFITCFYLSLASQIIPISVIVAIMLGMIILYHNHSKQRKWTIVIVTLFLIVNLNMWFLPTLGINKLYYESTMLGMNTTTSLIGGLSISYLIVRIISQYQKKKYNILDWMMIIFLLILLVPIFSAIVIFSGQYGFVFRRIYEGFYYLLIPISIVNICKYSNKLRMYREVMTIVIISTIVIVSLNYGIQTGVMSIKQTIENPRDTAQVISQISDYFQTHHKWQLITLLAPDRIPTSSGDFYLSSHLKTVPGTYINLGIIPRYTSKSYNVEEIQKIKSLVSCSVGIDDSMDYQKLLEQNQVDYLVIPLCKIDQTPTIISGTVVKELRDPLMGTYWLYKLT